MSDLRPRCLRLGRRALMGLGLFGLAGWLSACGLFQPATAGEASLQDILNNVQVAGVDGNFAAADNGAGVSVGSQVKTGDNSLARLVFSAGPTLRLSSNTSFSLDTPEMPEEVRLRLTAGRLRLSLFGHAFAIVTPVGLLHVAGFGDVSYQVGASPEVGDDQLAFRCFSGPCQFQSDAAVLELRNLEAVTVLEGGLTISHTVLAELDLRQFIADNPGSTGLLATLTAAPTATDTPAPPTVTAPPTATLAPAGLTTPSSGAPTEAASPTLAATATRTAAPFRTTPPRATATPVASAAPLPTETAPPASGGGGENPPPTKPPPPPPAPPPTSVPPTDTPVPPPTDTPLPEPPTKPPTDTPAP